MTPRILSLRPASFRGVPFEVDDASYEGGRRVQVHEYPQRDVPYAEDLGRSARGLSFSAFIVGDDYMDAANALISALETAGPGQLMHPWFGTLQVSVKDAFRVRFSRTTVGLASFELSFVESGSLVFPAASVATPSASRRAADGINRAAAKAFTRKYKTSRVADFINALTSKNWTTLLGALGVPLPGIVALALSNRLAGLTTSLLSTIAHPSTIPGLLLGALGLTPLINTTQRWGAIVQGLLRLNSSSALKPPTPAAVATPSNTQATDNIESANALVRCTLLSQAVGASSLMPVVLVDDALAIRHQLTAALDAESLLATDDAVYAALQTARAAVWNDITARARNAARLRTYTPPETQPALLVAYTLYGDASRAEEVVERNRIRHPGFVAAEPLQVLST